MMKIEFTEDYAGIKKGTIVSYDSMLASALVNKQKVAKYYVDKEPKMPKKS